MKSEISAGGVVVQKRRNGWYVLLMKDPNGSWTFPKGLVEKGEEVDQAAAREVSEEVGITQLTLISPLSDITYFYKRNGLIHKTVRYFLFEATGDETPRGQTSEGITDVQWCTWTRAEKIIGYPKTNRSLLAKAKKCLAGVAGAEGRP